MVARLLVALLLLTAAGCGASSEPSKQAEELHSIAAEGALLAHGTAEGGSTGPFTREHAKALRKLVAQLRPMLAEGPLAQLAETIDGELATLESDADAGLVERRLDEAAATAETLS